MPDTVANAAAAVRGGLPAIYRPGRRTPLACDLPIGANRADSTACPRRPGLPGSLPLAACRVDPTSSVISPPRSGTEWTQFTLQAQAVQACFTRPDQVGPSARDLGPFPVPGCARPGRLPSAQVRSSPGGRATEISPVRTSRPGSRPGRPRLGRRPHHPRSTSRPAGGCLHPQARRHQDHPELPGRIILAAARTPSRSAFTTSTVSGGGPVTACCPVRDGSGRSRVDPPA